jgi:8-oxo-dGTP diphosphatase
MAARAQVDARRSGTRALLLVFFLVFLVIIVVDEIAIFAGLVLFFVFVVLFVRVIGDEVQVDGMRLRNLEFGFALGTAQDLAFFDFVFIDIDFGGTFRATDHGSTLRRVFAKWGYENRARHRAGYYIPRRRKSTPVHGSAAWDAIARDKGTIRMNSSREYPERPVVGIGGVIIEEGRALLIRRGSEPLRGEWSIPGGTLELGESLEEGVARELLEETGIEVRVLELIEVFDRVFLEDGVTGGESKRRPRFHFVIADYLCQRLRGEPRAGSDVTDVAYAREEELSRFHLTTTATRVLKKAFAMERARQAAK